MADAPKSPAMQEMTPKQSKSLIDLHGASLQQYVLGKLELRPSVSPIPQVSKLCSNILETAESADLRSTSDNERSYFEEQNEPQNDEEQYNPLFEKYMTDLQAEGNTEEGICNMDTTKECLAEKYKTLEEAFQTIQAAFQAVQAENELLKAKNEDLETNLRNLKARIYHIIN